MHLNIDLPLTSSLINLAFSESSLLMNPWIPRTLAFPSCSRDTFKRNLVAYQELVFLLFLGELESNYAFKKKNDII